MGKNAKQSIFIVLTLSALKQTVEMSLALDTTSFLRSTGNILRCILKYGRFTTVRQVSVTDQAFCSVARDGNYPGHTTALGDTC